MNNKQLELGNAIQNDIKAIEFELAIWGNIDTKAQLYVKYDTNSIQVKNTFDDDVFAKFKASVIADYENKLVALALKFQEL